MVTASERASPNREYLVAGGAADAVYCGPSPDLHNRAGSPFAIGQPAGRVRRPHAADRLLVHVVPGQAHLRAVEGCALYTAQSAISRTCTSTTSPTPRSAGALRGERPVPRLHGLDDVLVLNSSRGAPDPARRAAGRHVHLVCYQRDGKRVFENYWTNGRGVEAMGNSPRCSTSPSTAAGDLGGLARRLAEAWGPDTEPDPYRTNGRPNTQWPRLDVGRSDDLGAG